MNQPNNTKFQFFCEYCKWKKITDGTDLGGIVEMKTSPVPTGIPRRGEDGKMFTPPPLKQKRKFKCPACGYVVIPKVVVDVQKNSEDKKKMEEKRQEQETLDSLAHGERLARRLKDETNRPDGNQTSS